MARGVASRLLVGLSGVVAVGVFAVVVARVVNTIRYQQSVPRDLHNARWEGDFVSSRQPVSGRMIARLPDPLPRDQKFAFELMVYYNVWSFFLSGKTARADFIGYLSSRSPAVVGAESRASVIPRQFSFELKGGSSGFPEDIVYVAILSEDNQYISGAYSASSGFDVGTFSMRKR